MRIESAAISLASQYSRVERSSVSESFSLTVGDQNRREQVNLSDEGKAAAGRAKKIEDGEEAARQDPKLALLLTLIEHLTGRKVRLLKLEQADVEEAGMPDPNPPRNTAGGFSLIYDYHAVHETTQQASFAAQGVVKTADGKEINFNLSFELQGSQTERVDIAIRAGDAARTKDPLVINFAGTAVRLTETQFAFDLDADGQTENVSFLAGGSGFLALDRNGDGAVNDGSELFGPATGNGFAELAAHDGDGNRFIDEADPIYAELRLFNRTESGDTLTTLQQAKVGAIYLGHVATPYETADGLLRSSGVYLKEDGGAGTVQQVDLKV